MLLSFKDAIIQSFSRPAANSIPSNVLEKVSNTVSAILTRIKIEFPDVYNEAYDKYQDCPHPLWSNDDDLELIMDIYK